MFPALWLAWSLGCAGSEASTPPTSAPEDKEALPSQENETEATLGGDERAQGSDANSKSDRATGADASPAKGDARAPFARDADFTAANEPDAGAALGDAAADVRHSERDAKVAAADDVHVDGASRAPSALSEAETYERPGPLQSVSGPAGFGCTVFRPALLGQNGQRHAVIIWGNGTFNTPDVYTWLFEHFASHGFVVVAANTSDAGSGREMIGCLDWILRQNEESAEYRDKIDTTHIAASGYSQGGCGALMAARDARISATAPVSPFMAPLGGCDAGAAIAAQTQPMFMISGNLDVVAERSLMQAPIFAQARAPIVWATHALTTHLEVLGDGGVYRGPLTAWFRYALTGDARAAAVFAREACILCDVPGWSVEHNALWAD